MAAGVNVKGDRHQEAPIASPKGNLIRVARFGFDLARHGSNRELFLKLMKELFGSLAQGEHPVMGSVPKLRSGENGTQYVVARLVGDRLLMGPGRSSAMVTIDEVQILPWLTAPRSDGSPLHQ